MRWKHLQTAISQYPSEQTSLQRQVIDAYLFHPRRCLDVGLRLQIEISLRHDPVTAQGLLSEYFNLAVKYSQHYFLIQALLRLKRLEHMPEPLVFLEILLKYCLDEQVSSREVSDAVYNMLDKATFYSYLQALIVERSERTHYKKVMEQLRTFLLRRKEKNFITARQIDVIDDLLRQQGIQSSRRFFITDIQRVYRGHRSRVNQQQQTERQELQRSLNAF